MDAGVRTWGGAHSRQALVIMATNSSSESMEALTPL